MQFTSDDIFEAIRTVWAGALAMDVEPVPADQGVGGGKSIAALIRIIGPWNGTVLLECPVALARSAAAILFNIPPSDVQSADMRDAVIELVQSLGNQVKASLPAGCRLVLPATLENNSWSGIRADWPVGYVVFRCQGQQASIAIAEAIGQTAMAMAA